MNIVTPMPTSLVIPTANPNTESARRDNVLRETIPQTTENEQGSAQKGLGSESDRARQPGQLPAPVTYERPQIQGNPTQGTSQALNGDGRDNASDESAGKENAEQQQQEQQEVQRLKERDKEVRTHEKAHAAIGGQYAGAPQYQLTTGPDGKRYATDGEVSIDISDARSPEQTLRKMQQVRAAALAPAQPSAQDLKVAAEASQKAFEARQDIAEANQQQRSPAQPGEGPAGPEVPTLDDIVDGNKVSIPTRKLDEALLAARQAQRDNDLGGSNRSLDIDGEQMASRNQVIQQFYAGVAHGKGAGFNASA
ncbi:putative metalloprotease CJM1_0395 family protein [Alteromonas sp. ASW11-19]|uniref:Metalloprotease CJM1_0395 family protein n=1 Tax=Alteromonas salexigens TaxID=2982530 RepID=A0ABT2VJV0_9ALTE|nr:putative metalloprotease CJM1_0395 family protein [Alteromonas salexigens]MCU7553531.1 putative metalloprotease CJM1_0395 family protein [Alteromonas salexigens]